MSTPFPILIGGKSFDALPPSFAFQKKNKLRMQELHSGALTPDEAQTFMCEMLTHCIKRVDPGLDVEALEDELDAIVIAAASVEIGKQTQKQVAAAYGIDQLGEATAGEA